MDTFLQDPNIQAINSCSSFPFTDLNKVQGLLTDYQREVSKDSSAATLFTLLFNINRTMANHSSNDDAQKLFLRARDIVRTQLQQQQESAIDWLQQHIGFISESYKNLSLIGTHTLNQVATAYLNLDKPPSFNQYEKKALEILVSTGKISNSYIENAKTDVEKRIGLFFATGNNQRGEGLSTFQFEGHSFGFSISFDAGKLVTPIGLTAEFKLTTNVTRSNARLLLVERLNENNPDEVRKSGEHSVYCFADLCGKYNQFKVAGAVELSVGFELKLLPQSADKSLDICSMAITAKASAEASASLGLISLSVSDATPFYYNNVSDLSNTMVERLGVSDRSFSFNAKAPVYLDMWSSAFDAGFGTGATLSGSFSVAKQGGNGEASLSAELNACAKQTGYRFQSATNESQLGTAFVKTQDTQVTYKQVAVAAKASAKVFASAGVLNKIGEKELGEQSISYDLSNSVHYENLISVWKGNAKSNKFANGSGYVAGHSVTPGSLTTLASGQHQAVSQQLIHALSTALAVPTSDLSACFNSDNYQQFVYDILPSVAELNVGALFVESSIKVPDSINLPLDSKGNIATNSLQQIKANTNVINSSNLEMLRICLIKQKSDNPSFLHSIGLNLGVVSLGFNVGKIEESGSYEVIDLFKYGYNSAAVINQPNGSSLLTNELVMRPKLLI